MKNILKTIGAVALSSVILTSCNEDDHTGQSLIDYSPVTVSLSSTSATSFMESAIDPDDASTFTVTIDATIPEVQPINIMLDIVQTGGTADSNDIVINSFSIPAGQTSASGTVEILQTGDVEPDETFSLTVVSRENAIVGAYEFNGEIVNDYINDVLEMELNWDGTVEFETEYSSGEYDFCAMDFDVLVYDAATFTDLGMYDAATGACPENIDFDSSTPDGDYLMVVDLYDNPYSTLGLSADVPVTLHYSQEYFGADTNGSFTTVFNTDDAGGTRATVIITKSGYTYTITPF